MCKVILICDSIKVPENTGMIFRLAEAFGVQKVYLAGDCISPPNVKITKASRSTIKKIPFAITPDTEEAINSLKQAGYTIIGLELTPDSTDIRHFDFSPYNKIALVIGSEKNGISPPALDLLDDCVEIKLTGSVNSLNVATALAIALFCITAALPSSGKPAFHPLSHG
jgi:23S rRNA (guanosine2251-2'-O)-methyltransferase